MIFFFLDLHHKILINVVFVNIDDLSAYSMQKQKHLSFSLETRSNGALEFGIALSIESKE